MANPLDNLNEPKIREEIKKAIPKWKNHKDEFLFSQKIILILSFVLTISVLFHIVIDILVHGAP